MTIAIILKLLSILRTKVDAEVKGMQQDVESNTEAITSIKEETAETVKQLKADSVEAIESIKIDNAYTKAQIVKRTNLVSNLDKLL